jgi:hypothetical protein
MAIMAFSVLLKILASSTEDVGAVSRNSLLQDQTVSRAAVISMIGYIRFISVSFIE